MNNWELNKELRETNLERETFKKNIHKHQQNIANMLLNEMGRDIDDVLGGKVKVKLSWKEKLKYKINYYINKIFEIL
jgi:hypothetical protein